MEILQFIKEYWVLITFFLGEIGVIIVLFKSIVDGIKCSLRNDILDIYDRCKDSKKITRYQYQSMMYSYASYKKLKGNSFIDEIIERIKEFELID